MSGEHWVPIGEMAKFIGLTVPKFRALHDRMGRPAQRKEGAGKTSPISINAPAWLAAWNVTPSDTAAQAARLKRAQADRAELELEKLRGNVLTLEEIEKLLGWFFERLGRAHQKLCRDCQQKVNETLNDAERDWNEREQMGETGGIRAPRASVQSEHALRSAESSSKRSGHRNRCARKAAQRTAG